VHCWVLQRSAKPLGAASNIARCQAAVQILGELRCVPRLTSPRRPEVYPVTSLHRSCSLAPRQPMSTIAPFARCIMASSTKESRKVLEGIFGMLRQLHLLSNVPIRTPLYAFSCPQESFAELGEASWLFPDSYYQDPAPVMFSSPSPPPRFELVPRLQPHV
jgi:hypothetical protein